METMDTFRLMEGEVDQFREEENEDFDGHREERSKKGKRKKNDFVNKNGVNINPRGIPQLYNLKVNS